MALYTPLSDADVAAVAARFGLPAPERIRPEPRGWVNTNLHLWAGGERFFLRVNEGKSDADVAFEAEAVRFLVEARFPAPRLVPAADGAPFARLPAGGPGAGKQAMLFAFAPGEDLPRAEAGPERLRRVGEQLGRLHELASAFPGDRANPHGPARVRAWLDAARPAAEGPGADPEVRAALPALWAALEDAARLPAAPRGLVHADLFTDNVLWLGDRVSAVLDWEMSCVEPFALDLAVALHAWCWTGAGWDPARSAALLAGYRSRTGLAPETREALHPWARFAALRFAASRVAAHAAARAAGGAARKDWRTWRDRLRALDALGEAGFLETAGV
jgi:homoserine kinase type II